MATKITLTCTDETASNWIVNIDDKNTHIIRLDTDDTYTVIEIAKNTHHLYFNSPLEAINFALRREEVFT